MSDQQSKRIKQIKDLFSRIAGRYDLFNHLASLGRDSFWRQAAARRAKLLNSRRLLDVAAGTGDLCLALSREKPGATIVGIDFARPMLARASQKFKKNKPVASIELLAADALKLPFLDCTFDSVSIAFGIRNIPDHLSALKEMRRVLVPGGRLIILELCFPREAFLFQGLYTIYLNMLIPVIGKILTRDIRMFLYLAESINAFPGPHDFIKTMQQAGFDLTGYKALTFGVCILFWTEKPA